MAIEVKKIGGWGDVVRISNGIIDIDVSTAFGPHILHLGFCGGQNFMKLDPDQELSVRDESLDAFYKGAVWHNYGGHRLWQSPEAMPRTYLPCNEPIEYEVTEKGGIFKQQLFDFTNTQQEIEIVMSENEAKADIIHRITNKNAWPVKFAPWALTVLKNGGLEIIPMPTKDTGLVSNGVIGIWPYGKLNDKRVNFGEKFIAIQPDCNNTKNFKIGISDSEKYAAYLLNGEMFVKTFDYEEGAEYPDGGMNFESFTNDKFIECESLGKLEELEYNQTATMVETWHMFKDIETPDLHDDEKIEKVMEFIKKSI